MNVFNGTEIKITKEGKRLMYASLESDTFRKKYATRRILFCSEQRRIQRCHMAPLPSSLGWCSLFQEVLVKNVLCYTNIWPKRSPIKQVKDMRK